MSEQLLFQPSAAALAHTHTTADKYDSLYARSVSDPDGFWAEQAKRLDWTKRPEIAGDWSFNEDDFRIEWFADGKLNASLKEEYMN